MAKTEKRQDRNTFILQWLICRRIGVRDRVCLFVCLFLQGLDLSGKGAILPLNKSLFDCFNRYHNK